MFRNDNLVSEIIIAANIRINPTIDIGVRLSIPSNTGIRIPNTDSNPRIIAAEDSSVYFCPMFCSNSATVVQKIARYKSSRIGLEELITIFELSSKINVTIADSTAAVSYTHLRAHET